MNFKTDYLKDCISDVGSKLGRMVPIDDFNRAFCIVCVNSECSRSKSNNLKFEYRVSNWEDTLFNNVSRANSEDPEFEHIRIKKFLPMENKNTYVMETLPDLTPVDPPPKTETEPEPEPDQVMAQNTENLEGIENTGDTGDIENKISVPQSAPLPQQTNTEFKQGTMLPGSSSKEVSLDPGQVFVFDDEE